ncbi:hypothetical protein GCM10028807_02790 [Spirosoma daeguense]
MYLYYYDTLKKPSETVRQYNKRLLTFAILHRFEKPAHPQYVAQKIVRLELTTEFARFDPDQLIRQQPTEA